MTSSTTIDLIPAGEEAPPAADAEPATPRVIPAVEEPVAPKKRGRPKKKSEPPPAIATPPPQVEEEPTPVAVAVEKPKEKRKPKPKAAKPKVQVVEEAPVEEQAAPVEEPVEHSPGTRRRAMLAELSKQRQLVHRQRVAMYTQILDKTLGY